MDGKHVVVTTIHKGVFFGILKNSDGDKATLTEARNCIYWSKDVKGFLGLAASGPSEGSRVGPAIPELRLYGVTSISLCTSEAVAAWEASPWSE